MGAPQKLVQKPLGNLFLSFARDYRVCGIESGGCYKITDCHSLLFGGGNDTFGLFCGII
jgi:hypothetical protein